MASAGSDVAIDDRERADAETARAVEVVAANVSLTGPTIGVNGGRSLR